MPDSLHWLRNSTEYRAAALQAYRLARDQLERAAAGRQPGSWAVILDADETVLDNSQYQKERSERGLGFTPESWSEWVRRRAAPPVPGSADFLRRVRELGGRIAIVTNRTEAECPDTEANFREQALPFDAMLCRPEGQSGEKEARFDSVARGGATPGLPPLEVLMWVGDNIQDFPDLTQASRDRSEELAAFGRRYVVLPNPVYGSWEAIPRN
jgi:5'-nucleotidase (lipoprotein e(P4) family)